MARSTGPKGRKLASGFAEPLPYAAGPSIGVDLHAPRLKRSREVVAAWSTALIFERDLVAAFKRAKLPRSAYEGPLELLVTWVEAELVDRAQHPSEFAAAERDLSEGDAIAQGLTVQPPPEPRVRPDCILPGCRGV
ncbi:MAG: hypothetical protein JWO31_4186, partial [Phycisphaerales bacterium]|nr:hypothetical protein [Phycisphaerales bacterium]